MITGVISIFVLYHDVAIYMSKVIKIRFQKEMSKIFSSYRLEFRQNTYQYILRFFHILCNRNGMLICIVIDRA